MDVHRLNYVFSSAVRKTRDTKENCNVSVNSSFCRLFSGDLFHEWNTQFQIHFYCLQLHLSESVHRNLNPQTNSFFANFSKYFKANLSELRVMQSFKTPTLHVQNSKGCQGWLWVLWTCYSQRPWQKQTAFSLWVADSWFNEVTKSLSERQSSDLLTTLHLPQISAGISIHAVNVGL